MNQGLFYTIFYTDAGWVGLQGSKAGLRRVVLPRPSEEEVAAILAVSPENVIQSQHLFSELVERLKAYFTGKKVEFKDKLDISDATAFQRSVWEATRLIPYGETRSYAWLAAVIGQPKAARAVGQALGKNPIPVIIPCHRVVVGNGGMGGFSGGIQMKGFLLGLESKKAGN